MSEEPNKNQELNNDNNDEISAEEEADFRDILGEDYVLEDNLNFFQRLQLRLEKSMQYESLDCQIAKSILALREKDMYKKSEKSVKLTLWISYLLSAFGIALVVSLIDIACFHANEYYTELRLTTLPSDVSETLLYRWLYWAIPRMIFCGIGAFIVVNDPIIKGSGVAKVTCFLNGLQAINSYAFGFHSLISKGLAITFFELGSILGCKDSPKMHIGSCIAASILNFRLINRFKSLHFLRHLQNDRETRNFILVGTASGMAAGFNCPVGGVIFGLECTARFYNQDNVWKMAIASSLCAFLTNIFLHRTIHIHATIGRFKFFDLEKFYHRLHQIPIYIIFGVIGGLIGAFFIIFNVQINKLRRKYLKKWWMKITEVIIFVAISTMVKCSFIYYIIDCKPVNEGFDYVKSIRTFCKAGEYNAMEVVYALDLNKVLVWLCNAQSREISQKVLIPSFILNFFITNFIVGAYTPLGIILPVAVVGAMLGRIFDNISLHLFGIANNEYPVILGAALFGGILRRPISFSVILLEAYHVTTPVVLPFVLVLVVSSFVSSVCCKSNLEDFTEMAPILPEDPSSHLQTMKTRHIMSSPVFCFKLVEDAEYIYGVLKKCRHNGFPIDDRSTGRIVGLILRSQLAVILSKGYFVERQNLWENEITQQVFRDFSGQRRKANLRLFYENRRFAKIDFNIFMNSSPFCVYMDKNINPIFRIFRGLALRHVIVVNTHNQVVGIITRKNFLLYS